MKAGLLCFAGLSAVAFAQPRGQHHRHQHHAKRDVVTDVDVVTKVDVATATAPAAVVYVNDDGVPIYTSYEGVAETEAATSSSAAAPSTYEAPATYAAPSSSSSAYVAPASTAESSSYVAPSPSTTSTPAASAYSAPASTSGAAPASSSAASSSGSDSGSGHGMAYSPYHTDNTCKVQSEVDADFALISDVSLIRTYGTDCDQTAMVLSAISGTGMKLFAGVYDITQVESEVQLIIDAANGNFDDIDTVSIGNEGVNDGTYTVAEVAAAVTAAKSQLSAAGYSGKVVTVDTFVAIIANPALCDVGDYVAANCHAFFDGGVTAENAGTFVVDQAQRVSSACGGKDTVITESGWPWQGDSNGQAVPSPANQAAAISSLKSSFSSNLILFTAFNDYWKTNNAGTFGAEQYWGILGNSASTSP